MSSSDNKDWLMTAYPDIFEMIMMTLGLSSLESLHRCRQVCRTWNVMIMKNIWENPSNSIIIKIRIEKIWEPMRFPYDEYISNAKWLGK